MKEMYPHEEMQRAALIDGVAVVRVDENGITPLKVEYEAAPPGDGVVIVDWVHPARQAGLVAGRNHAGDENVLLGLIEHGIGCALDESQPDDMREKSGEYVLGFAQGWREIMMITPLFLLTRQQTARVQSLPRRVRRAWLAEYERGVRRWQRAGGNLSGKRPVLPQIP